MTVAATRAALCVALALAIRAAAFAGDAPGPEADAAPESTLDSGAYAGDAPGDPEGARAEGGPRQGEPGEPPVPPPPPRDVLDNAYFVESRRFAALAAEAFDQGLFETAEDYVQMAREYLIKAGNLETERAIRAERAREFAGRLSLAMRNSEFPEALYASLMEAAARDSAFEDELRAVLEGPRYLRALVDRQNALPRDYSPADLTALGGGPYVLNRPGLRLRESAAASLAEMARAARADGVVLVVSSGYRSYDYQARIHARLIWQMGRAAAEAVSAPPGHSQHQTGLAMDFGCITDAFALTPAGRWMDANAGRFGWSLSYPKGYEDVTGYSWESWHFRYLGRELADFKESRFGGVQQFALRFLSEWERL